MDEASVLDWFRQHLFLGFGVRAALVIPAANLVVDLGLDSLDLMNLMFDIEDKFGLEIFGGSESDGPSYDQAETVGDAIRYILQHVSDDQSSSFRMK